ncbi:replication initiation protein [Salmonella enterica]|uniref:replication initiation protein n=1 Tax=Enterobacteriaceae TaxID=543 RepID=UPI000B95B6C1|nr:MULTISPECIES: replication initiation protein [Enterobacteriaceae]EJL0760031.1 replication initiation protein [Salmonella enterica]HBN5896365.1 replication initiation protein [Serratia marcescens]HBQ1509747.1 replication initiation protein [Klebsiella pneumoniae]EKK0692136.1 replication initiation protein [Escherichia coli]EKM9575980.1 replication initiation protein [Salmonella enterica]
MILQKEYSRSDFINQIISRPFCTDDFKRDGIYRTNKRRALNSVYIEHNNDSFINSIVFDIDSDTAAIAWQDADIPKPNFITQNPANGHAHLFYALSSPVCITENARRKPQKLLKGVIEGLTERLGADPCYTGKITKNPLNPRWRTFWNEQPRFELNYLCEFIDTNKRVKKEVRKSIVAEGRNTALFDTLRFYAYSIIFKYQKNDDFCGFISALEEEAEHINDSFEDQLGFKEINHTIRSISSWVWGTFDSDTFSEIQSNRAKKAKGKTKTNTKAKKLIEFIGVKK